MSSLTEPLTIVVGARTSPLSRTQVNEIQSEISQHHPRIHLEPQWIKTTGDKDLKTTLRTFEKTDFFTKEIDALLLAGKFRIGVHSAKDLPEPIPEGLRIIAVTKGIDPSDSLVLRQGETLESLPAGARIATSSERREKAAKQLRPDLTFMDLRGTIDRRLKKLDSGEADGVIVAEAALIRLGLTHLNRVTLPGETVPGQGQLAILARDDDSEMATLFSSLDTRRNILYLGLKPLQSCLKKNILHYPLIKIVPQEEHNPDIQKALKNLHKYTHILFTSKTTVELFFPLLTDTDRLKGKTILAVGKKTAQKIQENGIAVDIIAQEETAEGLVKELKRLSLEGSYCLWPHSALSRPILSNYFQEKGICFDEAILYDTQPNRSTPLPDLSKVGEIYFTSPSTVEAFLHFFGELPSDKILTPIGPVTAKHLFSYCPGVSA